MRILLELLFFRAKPYMYEIRIFNKTNAAFRYSYKSIALNLYLQK
jgi:hypothetical protein